MSFAAPFNEYFMFKKSGWAFRTTFRLIYYQTNKSIYTCQFFSEAVLVFIGIPIVQGIAAIALTINPANSKEKFTANPSIDAMDSHNVDAIEPRYRMT
ncbi:hypothetical protein PBN151_5181 [Paenibacillus sp. NAIST15-1]|nr:hypothetical protein PBN151_5181 [Paenibacillus sp. NAIST15-1]